MRSVRSMLLPVPLLALCLAGCAADDAGNGDDSDAGGALIPPPGCELGAPPAGFTYPPGPYGDDIGEVLANLTLNDCDGNPVTLGDVIGQSELTLLSIGAGWCEPCIEESEELEQQIHEPYCGRGLRVVQVLFQDEESRPATSLFCSQWKSRYGLTFPVLADPLFETGGYFESVQSQTPINLLIDSTGTIVYKETGTPANDLGQRIDEMLPQ